MRRLASFLRSVLPADPWQLVFLLGVTCLTFCPRLAWRPDIGTIQDVFGPRFDWRAFYPVFVLAIYPIIFAGLAGYFVCFWPGQRPVRRVLLAIVTPALVGLMAILVMAARSSTAQISVLQMNSHSAADAFSMVRFFVRYSVGLHYSFLGFLLVSTFTVRMYLEASHLPLILWGPQTDGEDELWERTKILVYLMIGPMYLVEFIVELPTLVAFAANIHLPLPLAWAVFSELAGGTMVLCLALWVIKAVGRQIVTTALRIPNRNFFLLAVGSAGAIAAAIPVSIYLYDRAYWAAFDYAKYSPPEFANYFSTPHLSVVGMITAAVIEEVIFRGFVQPRMIGRYGLMRGIFVTGVAWAAAHFRGDLYPHSDFGVVIHLALRIGMCVTLSFVFGWLTLKSQSILPAMVAHSALNFFVNSSVTFQELPGESQWAIQIALWLILAWALFRYWPPSVEREALPPVEEGDMTPATEGPIS